MTGEKQLEMRLTGMSRRYKSEDEIKTEKVLMQEQLENPDPRERERINRMKEKMREDIEKIKRGWNKPLNYRDKKGY